MRAGQEGRKCCRCLLCLVGCGVSSGTGAGWLASVVVVLRCFMLSVLVTCKPVGDTWRPFAPDYANGADACASPSILRWCLRFPLPAWSLRLPRGRCRSLDIEFVPLHTVFIALSACYGGRRGRITRLVPRTLDSLPPTFRSSFATLGPPSHRLARSVEDSLTRSATNDLLLRRSMPFVADWHDPRKLGSPHFVRSMPPAGVIRRTSYSPCALLLVARASSRSVALTASCRRVAGRRAPPYSNVLQSHGALHHHPGCDWAWRRF